MITGLNHLTVAVSELDRSYEFYVNLLGFKPAGRWDKGAYLSADELWLCLSLDSASPAKDFTHYAFCLLYTSPSPRDGLLSRMPSSA